MDYEIFKNNMIDKISIINENLTEKQIKQFYNYMNLLIEWNKKINLTAIIEPDDIILKHFVDSLTISKEINENDVVADIGTGAGFPGLPIKILKPDARVILIDSLNKRIKFLGEVVASNDLKDIQTIHSRAEEIGHNKQFRGQCDIVVSRAVAKLNVLLEYMMPLVKVGRKMYMFKRTKYRRRNR